MLPRPPGSTLTYTLFPYTPLFRSPNSGTFDEKRFVAPGPLPDIVEWRGVKLGLPICEDGWLPAVCQHLAAQGAELLISVNGSPYEIDKDDRRLTQVFRSRVAETKLPLIFLNRIGGQDELVFDGCSFVLHDDEIGRATV